MPNLKPKIYLFRLEDDGIYTCRASNKAGVDDQTTRMNILVPPDIMDDGTISEIDVVLHQPTFLNVTSTSFSMKPSDFSSYLIHYLLY